MDLVCVEANDVYSKQAFHQMLFCEIKVLKKDLSEEL